MVVRIAQTQKAVARMRAEVAHLRHYASCFEADTPQHKAAVANVEWLEAFVFAESRLLLWAKRRLRLYRSLGMVEMMGEPKVEE